MRLKIRRLDPTIPLPTYATGEAAGFDLVAAHDAIIAPGRVALVKTGLVGTVREADRPASSGLSGRAAPRPCRPVTSWAFSPEAAPPLKRGLLGTVRESGPSSQHWFVGSRSDPTYGVGIIDPDYSGPDDEIMIQVLNFTAADVQIRRGDRLAQAVVLPAPRVAWDEVSEIRPVARGGFGATGK